MTDMTTQDALLAAYKQVEAELYSILNHFDRRALLPDNVTPQDVQEAVALLFERLDKQERILAALREPSEQVKKAVGRDEFVRLFTGEWETIPVGYDLTAAMIRAAVGAAEQEVGDA